LVWILYDGEVYVKYGIGDYTLAQAQAAAYPTTLPEEVVSFGILAAKIIIQKSATTFTVDSAYTTRYPITAPSDHGSLAGLSDNDHPQYLLLTDIDDTPVDTVTNAPISSNWAYDHTNAADPHTGYMTEAAHALDGHTMTIDGVDVSAHDVATTGVHGVGAGNNS